MNPDDLVVEVRDRDLVRRGQIDARFLTGSIFNPRPNDVGSWTVTLPEKVDDETLEAATLLRQKGAGIIVTGPHGVILSGPTVHPEGTSTADDPGTWTIEGVTDTVLLRDTLALPDPTNPDRTKQRVANDTRTGRAETLLRQFVSLNACNGAIAHGGPQAWAPAYRLRGFRRQLRLADAATGNRGPIITKSPRYQNLLELCQEIVAGTDLLFEVRQQNDHLELHIWEAADLRLSHRMDIDNDQLQSTSYAYMVPALTEAYVAGQGEGTERTVLIRTSAAAQAEEEAWGRPIELFVDQRQTDDLVELVQKGDATLAEALAATDSLTVVPSDDLAASYGDDWTAGALVTVVVADEEIPARITQAVIAITTRGLLLGCRIGDTDGTDWEGRVNGSLQSLGSRLSSLERNGSDDTGWVEVGSPGAALQYAPGWSGHKQSGWSGVRYRIKAGVLFVDGAAQKATAVAVTESIILVPATLRPPTQMQGVNVQYLIPQYAITAGGTAAAVSISISWPLS